MAIETEKVVFNALKEGDLFKYDGSFYLRIKETWVSREEPEESGLVNALSIRTNEKIYTKGSSIVDRYSWKKIILLL